MKFFALFFILVSCSSAPRWSEDSTWTGAPVHELDARPELSEMSLKTEQEADGKEIRTYKKRAPYRSKANCLALGGCMGMPVGQDCTYQFTLMETNIIKAQHTPGCALPRLK